MNIKIGFSIIQKYKVYYIFSIIFSIISALLLCLSPYLMGRLIDNLGSNQTNNNYILFFLLMGCYFISLLFQSISDFTTSTMSEKMGHYLRGIILNKILKINLNEVKYTDKNNNGEMISLFGRDIDSIWDMFGFGITNFISSLVLIVSFCFVVFFINIYIGILLILISILFVILFYYNGKKVRGDFAYAAPEYDKMQSIYNSTLSGLLTIFSFNIRDWIKSKILLHSYKTVEFANSAHKKSVYFTFLTGFINLLSLGFVWIYFIYQFPSGNMKIGEFVSILFYFSLVTKPLEQIGESSKSFNKGYISLLRIQKFIKKDEKMKNDLLLNVVSKKCFLEIFVNKLIVDNKTILSNINFEINKNVIVGVAGESGSGKTSLLKLIAKLNEGYFEGNILLNNNSIYDMSEESFRKNVGFLPQFFSFFPLDLKDNIFFNMNNSDLLELVSKLNLGKVFENINVQDINSLGLSGGEKQRLNLLRIFIRNYSLLIMDEPTSALDKFNKNAIVEILFNLKENGKTIIISSHDESILKECDCIYFIENGNLIDSGTHDSLFEKNSKYVKMLSKRINNDNSN